MPENIIDKLKAKEDEMESLVAGARKKAAAIREEAVRKAMELKKSGAAGIEEELSRMKKTAMDEVDLEVRKIDAEAEAAAKVITAAGAERKEEAVRVVARLISEGIHDREDDEGPDYRA